MLEKLAPFIDAMNIDLKGFTDRYYREVLKGDRKMVMDFIARAAQVCHVEVTTLIIPGENDSEEEMDALSSWIAGLTDEHGKRIGQTIPLHISRFFPRFHMQDRLLPAISYAGQTGYRSQAGVSSCRGRTQESDLCIYRQLLKKSNLLWQMRKN